MLSGVSTHSGNRIAGRRKITLPGFCSVEIVDKPARKARNPATGQEIEVPAKKSIKFKAGKEFVDKVNH
ncbi:HU family DNA-binding protein [Acidithiobacillus thiooxidans]|uniref:HU family DNA-binding protein n=1 Tax=Acidithiobacillus thiooxidans TaxID=930 RepID=UPI0028562F41|nr:HU family DNA-binding protein [Acidithiobacillus thiooxidans]MDR7925950.1 HU family DNA-binding protein [Acidithiobacillus thiooxidans]